MSRAKTSPLPLGAGREGTRFVGVQFATSQTFLMNLLVPGVQQVGQAMPHLHQAARRHLHSQVKVERVDDLADRQPLQEVQHRREHQRTITQRASRQHVRQFRLDACVTGRAVVSVDRIFGDDRFEVLGNVFASPRSCLRGAFELSATVRAAIALVISSAVRSDCSCC